MLRAVAGWDSSSPLLHVTPAPNSASASHPPSAFSFFPGWPDGRQRRVG